MKISASQPSAMSIPNNATRQCVIGWHHLYHQWKTDCIMQHFYEFLRKALIDGFEIMSMRRVIHRAYLTTARWVSDTPSTTSQIENPTSDLGPSIVRIIDLQ